MENARKYKVGLVQMRMGPDPDANLESAIGHIREAAKRGANIVCLPELFRAQYFCQREDIKLFDLAEPIPGPSTTRLAEVAKESRVVIVASLFERRAPGLYHNTAVTLGQDGSIISVYRKMHIPDDPLYYEKFYFTPGDLGFKAVDTAFGRVGTLVCWDQWYPEGARLTALQGAEVLFYPTAIGWHPAEKEEFGAAQYDAWQTIQRAHAIANGVYVAGVNRVGHETGDIRGNCASGPGLEFWGGSFLADPFGRIVAKASHTEEEILIGEIDLALLEDTRRNWPFLRDRRIDAYAPITKRFIDFDGQAISSEVARRDSAAGSDLLPDLLGAKRLQFDEIPNEPRSGIYAFFLKDCDALPMVKVGNSGLLYVGMTSSSIGKRNPVFHEHASSHTLRRSLGAILKQELNLQAIPRGDGNTKEYRFEDSGEERLTAWMKKHLAYSYVINEGNTKKTETHLIDSLCPPLNLDKNPRNGFAPMLKKAREKCRGEAETFLKQSGNPK
jgi:N-carbamoylputrescine amidase